MASQEMPKAYESAEIEQKWYAWWENNGLFRGKPNPDKKPYSIVIPPPNVTGILTMGHVLNNTLQDILMRWHRMEGYECCWFPGTDHAGIATEARVAKELRKTENIGRDDLGRDEFIKRVWEGQIRRNHYPPAPQTRRLLRLGARAFHHGRRPQPRRPQSLRSALQQGVHLSRTPHDQLVPRFQDRPFR